MIGQISNPPVSNCSSASTNGVSVEASVLSCPASWTLKVFAIRTARRRRHPVPLIRQHCGGPQTVSNRVRNSIPAHHMLHTVSGERLNLTVPEYPEYP